SVCIFLLVMFFFFSSRRRHTRSKRDWSSDVCSSDLHPGPTPCLPAWIGRAWRPGRLALQHVKLDRRRAVAPGLSRIPDEIEVKRSEERRVGKECRCRWERDDYKKKEKRVVNVIYEIE